MRALSLAFSGLLVLVALGCPANPDKPIPVNTEGGDPAGQPAEPAGGTEAMGGGAPETTQPGGMNEEEAAMAGDLAQQDVAFKESLEMLKEAAVQDIALAEAAREQEAIALEKLGVALSDEVTMREQQELEIARTMIAGLKEKGFDVWANIVDIPKPLPAAAAAIIDPLQIGQTSRVIEWRGGYGIVRKMGESDAGVKVGYIYASKEVATMATQPGVSTSPDGTTTVSDPASGASTTTGGADG